MFLAIMVSTLCMIGLSNIVFGTEIYQGNCGENISWELKEDGSLIISGSGSMYSLMVTGYKSYFDTWPNNIGDKIKSIVIGEGVTKIGHDFFADLDNLQSINFPSTLEEIGDYAFYGCDQLSHVQFPENLTSIDHGAFMRCSSLSKADLPRNLEHLGMYAFEDALITSVYIPASLNSIECNPFTGCKNLCHIVVDSKNEIYDSRNNCNAVCGSEDPYSILSNAIIFGCSSTVIPKDITRINQEAFSGTNISSINIPDGVTHIEYKAFSYCYNLKSVKLPSDLVEIELFAFECCVNLERIYLPNSIEKIGSGVFFDCISLESINIPSGIEKIPNGMVDGCSKIDTINIPQNVREIGENAFFGTNIKSIFIPENIEYMDNKMFGIITSRTEIGRRKTSREDNSGITIKCFTDSYAHDYAIENDIAYELVDGYDFDTDGEPYNPAEFGSSYNGVSTKIKSKQINFFSQLADSGKQEVKISINWGWDKFLNGSAKNYDADLAIAGLTLAGATEHSQARAESALSSLGFSNPKSHYYSKPWYTFANPGVSFGYKEILKNGEKSYIFAVIVRGTDVESVADWHTDISSIHGGFEASKLVVKSLLEDYMEEVCGTSLSNIKNQNNYFYIAGHSLGGAVANNLACSLDEYSNSDKIHCYAFAPARCCVLKLYTGSNIHNIMNKEDIVPNFVSDMTTWNGEEWWFDRNKQTNINSNFMHITSGKSLDLTMQFWVMGGANPIEKIKYAHVVDTYMAYLLTTDGNRQLVDYKIKVAKIHCPVDIEVYDSGKNLVGKVVNNVVDNSINGTVYIDVNGDEKDVYMPIDDLYTIKITGNDNGFMDYSIGEYSLSDNAYSATKTYNNVEIKNQKELETFVINDNQFNLSETELYTVDYEENKLCEIESNGHEDSERIDITNLSATLEKDTFIFDGSAKVPKVNIVGLTENIDYELEYRNNTYIGTAGVIIKGKGNYAGVILKKFTIKNNDDSESDTGGDSGTTGGSDAGGSSDITGGGSSVSGGESVQPSNEKQEDVKDNSEQEVFTIPKVSFKSIKAGKNYISLKWKKQDVAGYQIQYSTVSNFKKSKTKAKNLNKGKTTTHKIKKLKPNKRYYFRIRSYQRINNSIQYSDWSKRKSAKTKRK